MNRDELIDLENASNEAKNDKDYVLKAIKQNWKMFEFASDNLKRDKQFVLKALKLKYRCLMFASDELKDDEDILNESLDQMVKTSVALGPKKKDRVVSREEHRDSVVQYGTPGTSYHALRYASERLKSEKRLVMKAVQTDGYALFHASNELKNDRDIVLEAVKIDGMTLQFASQKLRGDKDVVLVAVNQDGNAIVHVSEELKKDLEVNLRAVKRRSSSIQHVHEDLKNDIEFMSLVMQLSSQEGGSFLQYAGDELKDDKEFVMGVVKENGCALEFASQRLRNDKDVVFEATKHDGFALRYAGEIIKNDKDVILESMKQNGSNLRHASKALKSDRQVISLAVKQDGMSLRYASKDLKNDKEIVLTALKQVPSALLYASPQLKKDVPFLCSCLEKNVDCRKFVSKRGTGEEFFFSHRVLLESAILGYTKRIAETGVWKKVIFSRSDELIVTEMLFERSRLYNKVGRRKNALQDLMLHFQFQKIFHYDRKITELPEDTVKVLESVLKEEITVEKIFTEKVLSFNWTTDSTVDEKLRVKWKDQNQVSIIDSAVSVIITQLLKGLYAEFEEKVVKEFIREEFDHSKNLVEDETRDKFEEITIGIISKHYNIILPQISQMVRSQFGCHSLSIPSSPQKENSPTMKVFGFLHPETKNVHGYGVEFQTIQTSRSFAFKKKKEKNQRVFCGHFVNGIRDGSGKIFSPSNGHLIFEGSFRNGKREGKGMEYTRLKDSYRNSRDDQIDAVVFQGRYKNGNRHGRGESYNPKTGVSRRGFWNLGLLDESSVRKFECPTISYEEIKMHLSDDKVLGRGAFGTVYLVPGDVVFKLTGLKEMENKKNVAVKIMKVSSRFEFQKLYGMTRRGISLCHSLQSRNVLETYAMVKGFRIVGYVMSLCERSMDNVIISLRYQPMDMNEKKRILYETSLGMKTLHSHLVMHRDLKWGNILLDSESVVKITDFDTFKEDELQWRLRSMYAQSSLVGTPGFLAPEVFLGKEYSLKCDVYAFGMMIFSLLWGMNMPHATQYSCVTCGMLMNRIITSNSLDYHVANCNLRPLLDPKTFSKFPSFLIDLMVQCWDKNPFNRPTFDEIVYRFEVEKKKTYSVVILTFPNHKGVSDQKMFLTKPYRVEKLIEWIERKFNKDSLTSNEDEGEDEDEGEEEDTRKKNSQKKRRKNPTRVLSLHHEVLGTISIDEDLERVIRESSENPILEVTLDNVNESYVMYDNKKNLVSMEDHQRALEEIRDLRKEVKNLKRMLAQVANEEKFGDLFKGEESEGEY